MIDIERLKARLVALHMTANAASEKAGLGRSYVRDILRGRIKDPSAWRLSNLAETLQCTPSFLLGKSDGEGYDDFPNPDDRTKPQLTKILNKIEIAERSNTPSYRLMFDLLDSVDDRKLVELVYNWVSEATLVALQRTLPLSAAEIALICGSPDSADESDYAKRLIIGKLTGLIDQMSYSRAVILSAVHEYFSENEEVSDLSDERCLRIISPILKTHGLAAESTSKETIRITIMAIFSSFLQIETKAASSGV